MKKKFPLAFCSLSFTLSSLLIRGLKLVGSLRNVIRSRSKKVFIPESSPCGECAVVCVASSTRGKGFERQGGEGCLWGDAFTFAKTEGEQKEFRNKKGHDDTWYTPYEYRKRSLKPPRIRSRPLKQDNETP